MHVLRAILLMTLAMACLALGDLFIKLASRGLSPGEVMFFLSAGGTALFVLLARVRRVSLISPLFWNRKVMARNGCEVVAAIGLVLGISWTPLPIVAAVMQTTPLLVTLGAALFLGETVGWRRWGAIMAGLVGMLLVVRPGMAGFEPAALLLVMGSGALAARDLLTRQTPGAVDSLALSTWGFAVTIPTALVVMLATESAPAPDAAAYGAIAACVVATTVGYYILTIAMRLAPASIVSPFRYSRLVFTMGLGVIVLGDRPDALTLFGALIILVAGLYGFYRERQLALAAMDLHRHPG